MYIDDCVKGIDMIMHSDALIATAINLGTSELVTINELVSKVEKIAGVKLKREYDLTAPRGVAGRNSDNTFIKKMLKWEPRHPLDTGLRATYKWIKSPIPGEEGGQAGGGLGGRGNRVPGGAEGPTRRQGRAMQRRLKAPAPALALRRGGPLRLRQGARRRARA